MSQVPRHGGQSVGRRGAAVAVGTELQHQSGNQATGAVRVRVRVSVKVRVAVGTELQHQSGDQATGAVQLRSKPTVHV